MNRYVAKVKADGVVMRALTGPTLHREPNLRRAERSRWTYRLGEDGVARLTPLGALHSLIGLTLEVRS